MFDISYYADKIRRAIKDQFSFTDKQIETLDGFIDVAGSKIYTTSQYVDPDNNLLFMPVCRLMNLALDEPVISEHVIPLVTHYSFYKIWESSKTIYEIDPDIVRQFHESKRPNRIDPDVVCKLPADVIFIDYNDKGDTLFKGLQGTFVNVSKVKSKYLVSTSNLIDKGDFMTNAVLRFEIICEPDYSYSIKCCPNDELTRDDLGIYPMKATKIIANFVINFLSYMHAVNADVEVIVREKERRTRHNASDRVNAYAVGVHYGSTVRSGKKRYKYVYSEKNVSSGEKPKWTVRAHFRSGHFNGYWVGTGDNKRLVYKWIPGKMVGGKGDPQGVRIHKVE